MWVIKLGGSLLGEPELFTDCLNTIIECKTGSLVIVPGGGLFADVVREIDQPFKLSAAASHLMAMRAMEQTGLLICDYHPAFRAAGSPDAIASVLADGRIPVFFPSNYPQNQPSLHADWSVTSDSISAWLAGHIDASHLILVKSLEAADSNYFFPCLVEEGVVDAAFPDYMSDGVAHYWTGPHGFRALPAWLQNPQTIPGKILK